MESLKLCLFVLKGDFNNLSGFTLVPPILLKEALELLNLLICASIKLNIGKTDSPTISIFIKQDGVNILYSLVGHPNNEEISELANKVINNYFKK